MIYDKLDNQHLYRDISPRIATALDFLVNTNLAETPCDTYKLDDDNVFAMVQEYETKAKEDVLSEGHYQHIDVQYIVEGEEFIGVHLKGDEQPEIEKPEDDYKLYDCPTNFIPMKKGMFMILFPGDLHMPCIRNSEQGTYVKKVVVKVKV